MTASPRLTPDEPLADIAEERGAPAAAARASAPATRPEADAIFIVGVSRSGTTLMRNVLNSHSRIAIANENHYLGHLLPWEGARHAFRAAGDLREDASIRRLVALIYSAEFLRGSRLREASPFWGWIARKVPPAELEERLLAAERTERGIFTALLRTFADRRGKAIIGEKTPAHVAWVETLLDWYPGGRIVHMMRDPRAVFVSELRRRSEHAVTFPYRWLVKVPVLMRGFVLLEVAWAWAGAVSRHRSLSRMYPDEYRIVRFEDLVREPEATIDGVCAFLGVAPEPRMLQQKVTSKGSRLGQSGFDADAAERWRTTIGAGEGRWLGRLLGKRIEEMGYPRS
jgi:hypothetical protein